MKFSIDISRKAHRQRRGAPGGRQTRAGGRSSVSLAIALTLIVPGLAAGCGWVGSVTGSAEGDVEGFGGAVAADEPQAALVARDTLAAGGSAADAAVAAFFTMSVTYPNAASLGSGGACLVYDRDRKIVEAIDFTHPNAGGRGAVPLPASPRGMLALHAKYGALPWTQLIGPAESFARFGHTVSRAGARVLAANPGAIAGPGMTAIFADELGNPVAEGGKITQPDLAQTLGLLRRNPRRFYAAPFAEELAAAYRNAGVQISAGDLAAYTPRTRTPVRVERANQVAFFAPTPGGLVAAQAWAMLFRAETWSDAEAATRPHLIAEVSRRAYADAGRFIESGTVPDDTDSFIAEARIRGLLEGYNPARKTAFQVPGGPSGVSVPPDMGSASVVTADRFGQAVACAFTMNATFGGAAVAPDTGIVVAGAPDPRRGTPALSLMALGFGTQWQLEYMGAATGGGVAPIAVTAGAARMLLEGRTVEQLVDAPRYVTEGVPDRMMIEDRHDARPMAAGLRERGHDVRSVPSLGRLNVLACPEGFAGPQSQCDIRTDRRGAGFAQLY